MKFWCGNGLFIAPTMPVNKLHLQAVEQVRASYQSKAYAVVEPVLTEEELAALKRGRNISSIKPPKNGTMQDYRRATGLECLFGYLYLKGEIQRINELFLMIEEHLEQGSKKWLIVSLCKKKVN